MAAVWKSTWGLVSLSKTSSSRKSSADKYPHTLYPLSIPMEEDSVPTLPQSQAKPRLSLSLGRRGSASPKQLMEFEMTWSPGLARRDSEDSSLASSAADDE